MVTVLPMDAKAMSRSQPGALSGDHFMGQAMSEGLPVSQIVPMMAVKLPAMGQ